MDFQSNNQNNQNWDRWNSSSEHSSYHNQPTHRPYGQGFMIASLICGVLSITACCTGIFSLPLGALGILFALFTYRKGKKMSGATLTGILLSLTGIITGISILAYSFYMLPSMMQDPAFRYQLDSVTEQLYGMDFSEFMEEFYHYDAE